MTQLYSEKNLDTFFARFFSGATIRSFLNNPDSIVSYVHEMNTLLGKNAINVRKLTYSNLFEVAYDHLQKNYRNEYIYKNAIANKILLGIHSLNTSFMLQEFRVGNCKADSVILNGTSNVYEIKSELDSLERLQNQLTAYLQVFDKVHVITFPGHAQRIKKVIPSKVGLMELNNSNRGSISTIREARSGKKTINTALLFDSLRKHEYQAIIKNIYGSIPEVPNTKMYSACKALFTRIKPEIAHDLAVIELKKRGSNVLLKDFISSVPDYFRSLSLRGDFSDREREEIINLLGKRIQLN